MVEEVGMVMVTFEEEGMVTSTSERGDDYHPQLKKGSPHTLTYTYT